MKAVWTVFGATTLVVALALWSWSAHGRSGTAPDRLLLLLPDGVSLSDPKVTLWLDAASEEGLHVVPMRDSDFTKPFFGQPACAGVILPDMVHQEASDLFIASLRRYVAGGGHLMLVYDAGTFTPEGKYAKGWSRLSDLAGVDYALYDRLQSDTIHWGGISANSAVVRQMDIPPGKYYPFRSATQEAGNFEIELKRYEFGDLHYPSYVTSGNYDGKVLFHSDASLVAGERNFDKGSVLFVNAPLGYLKANTDGLLLHSFLKYFAEHTLGLPYLVSAPDGVGGLVLNWHVDSNAAIKPLQQMRSWTMLQQGTFSIHVTAGPDTTQAGDRRGFDVSHNKVSQELIREHVERGDEIGSHGGWMHDYFASHVEKDNPKDLEHLLEWNKTALEAITGKPVVEYSAPEGNQPKWVTSWLDTHGFLAYYFTGDTGMGPTQGYRDGMREGQNVWAFPIVHLNKDAAFEEMTQHRYTSAEIEQWLEAMSSFTADHRCVRLLYFHPPGIVGYHKAVDQWLEQTARLQAQGQFRWYTMAEVARFLNSRKQVQWMTSENGGRFTIVATHPQTLEHETWRLPAGKYSEPVVDRGNAKVVRDNDSWMVIAGPGTELQFESKVTGP